MKVKIKEGLDGFLNIKIKELGIVTVAKDLDDAKIAIEEAIIVYKLNNLMMG